MGYALAWPEQLLDRISELGLSLQGEYDLVERIDSCLCGADLSEVYSIRPLEIYVDGASVFASIAAKQVGGHVLINFWELSVIWPDAT